MESLRKQSTLKRVRKTLQGRANGSKALDIHYETIMEKIEAQEVAHREFTMKALSWMALAKSTLTAAELRSALAVEPDDTGLDPDNIVSVHDLASLCAGLIMVDDSDEDIIRLMHHTTHDYLNRTQHRWFPNAENSIAEACTTYLSFDVFRSGICLSDEAFAEPLRSHCFYDYAAHHWGRHTHKCSELSPRTMGFLQDKSLLDASTQAMFVEKAVATPNYSQVFPKQVTALHVAAYFGLDRVVLALLAAGHQPNCKDSTGQTPLWWSAKDGHEAATKVLCDRDTITLHMLIRKNQMDLVKPLLDAGYNVNIPDFRKRTPLHNAITSRDLALATALVSFGADLNARDMNGMTPLRMAIGSKRLELIALLLQKSAYTMEISPLQWRETFDKDASDILKLTEESGGGHALHFLRMERQAEVAQMTAGPEAQRHIMYVTMFLFPPATQQLK